MLVVVKTPHIKLRVEGRIQPKLLKVLQSHFGEKLKIRDDSGNNLVNIFETPWYRKHKTSMTPGKYLKIYRANLKWTQIQVGSKLKVPKQYVSDMENDRRSISKKIAKALSKLFDAPLEHFI